jgi:dynactin complex subunit
VTNQELAELQKLRLQVEEMQRSLQQIDSRLDHEKAENERLRAMLSSYVSNTPRC